MKRYPLYVGPFTKIYSALCSALSLSLFLAIDSYIPINERNDDMYYYPIGYELIIGLIINLAIFIMVVMPLSILTDGIVLLRFKVPSIKRTLAIIISYCILGIVGGMIFSIFIGTQNLRNIIIFCMMGAFIYLVYQFLISWFFNVGFLIDLERSKQRAKFPYELLQVSYQHIIS